MDTKAPVTICLDCFKAKIHKDGVRLKSHPVDECLCSDGGSISATDSKWTSSWLDKPIGEEFDRHSPLCSLVNMGVHVKHKDHHKMEYQSGRRLTFGRLLAFSDDEVLVADITRSGAPTCEMSREYFEQNYIGD